jgi:acetyl-CoA acetyltransferase
MKPAYILDVLRTPISSYGFALASVRPDDHAALVIKSHKRENVRYGLAPMCIGVGQGTAIIYEKC